MKVYAVYQRGEVDVCSENEFLEFVDEIRQRKIAEIMELPVDMVIDKYAPEVLFDMREF